MVFRRFLLLKYKFIDQVKLKGKNMGKEDRIVREYNTIDERNKAIEKMYSKGYHLVRLYGDGNTTRLTAEYIKDTTNLMGVR